MPIARIRLRVAALASLAGGLLLLLAAATAAAAEPSPSPSAAPSASPAPSRVAIAATPSRQPNPTLSPAPTPMPTPPPPAVKPASMNLYQSTGFRYQDPYYSACVSTAAMVMLNAIDSAGSGGSTFRWVPSTSSSLVQSMLTWTRAHDTLSGGTGSDPNGWRNALNFYGWGEGALLEGYRRYEVGTYKTYAGAVKAAVRAMLRTRKPVGVLAHAGHHAQWLTGYYGLHGDPFATASDGSYTDAFTVDGFYLSDPLKSDGFRNAKITYSRLRDSTNLELRFRKYLQTDSLLDDPYTVSTTVAKDAWYGRFVLVIPRR
jgi:hypothetical protein